MEDWWVYLWLNSTCFELGNPRYAKYDQIRSELPCVAQFHRFSKKWTISGIAERKVSFLLTDEGKVALKSTFSAKVWSNNCKSPLLTASSSSYIFSRSDWQVFTAKRLSTYLALIKFSLSSLEHKKVTKVFTLDILFLFTLNWTVRVFH